MPQIAELKEIDGSVWARIPMELGSPIQILAPTEIEANREREIRHLNEIERLREALTAVRAEIDLRKAPKLAAKIDAALNQQKQE